MRRQLVTGLLMTIALTLVLGIAYAASDEFHQQLPGIGLRQHRQPPGEIAVRRAGRAGRAGRAVGHRRHRHLGGVST